MKHFESNSAEDTYNIGKELGEKAEAGQVFALDGDLGTGKTVFTKGFAEGLGIKEPVNSPTFTILQIYEDGRLPLYHFDVYRIEEPEEMDEVGFDDYIYGSGVCMIEWADQIREILPENADNHDPQGPVERDRLPRYHDHGRTGTGGVIE